METKSFAARSRTIAMEAEVEIDAPAAEAWAVLSDYTRDVEWRKGVRSMVPTPAGPVRPGTTAVEWIRAAGRTVRNDGVVTAFAEGHRFAWRTTAGVDAEGSREVAPLGAGECRVRLELRVRPPDLFRLVPGLLRWSLQRTLAADAARLRTLVELGPHALEPSRSTGTGLTGSGRTPGDDRPGDGGS